MSVIFLILILIVSLAGAVFYGSWAMRKACRYILSDLKRQKALDPDSAVALPYAKRSLLHFGLRDYRPNALDTLVKHDFIRMTAEGKFYLGKANGDGTGKELFNPEA